MAAVPTNLAVFYPRQAWSAWQALSACALLMGITAAICCSRKRYAMVGWLWFLIALSPVIGVLQVGDQALADRYTYLPLIGIFVGVVWFLGDVAERTTGAAARRAVVYLTAGALTVYALAAALQVTHWRDSVTLFAHTADVTRGNYLAHYNLGVALAQRQQFAEAANHYAMALQFKPTYLDAHVNLGAALEILGNRAGAEAQYRVALELDPNDADAKANLDALLAGGSLGSKGGSTMPTTAPSPPSP
jgi:tetratricopeptide (TPR) repeat protein